MSLSHLAAQTVIDTLSRGIPAGTPATELDRIGDYGWVVPAEDLTLPALTLNEVAFAHNIEVINRYAAEHGVFLCAHGKTMMAPQLLGQVLAGERTVGLCAATIQQASVMAACGARVVFIVNQVVGRANIVRLAELIEQFPESRFLMLVDSIAGVEQLIEYGAPKLSVDGRFNVLIEVGIKGGRAGVRTLAQANQLIDYLSHQLTRGAPVDLAGVSAYEGAIPGGDGWSERTDQLFAVMAEVYGSVRPYISTGKAAIVSAGGSATFDLVVNSASLRDLPGSPQIWLRPGVAPTFDHVVYQERLAAIDERRGFVLNGQQVSAVFAFRPALALWAAVQSIPDQETAIVAAGIRDFPADAGYPTLLAQYRRGRLLGEWTPGEISISKANDQHGYLSTSGLKLEVGDVLKFGISHPCTAFDKWPVLFCVDEQERVTRAVRTYF